MHNIKDLILLEDAEQAKKISIMGSSGEVEVFVLDRDGQLYQLTVGDLDSIRSSIPNKVLIELAITDFLPGKFQQVGYLDLRIKRSIYDKFFQPFEDEQMIEEVDLSKSRYWTEFETQVKSAISNYPRWAEAHKKRRKISKNAIKDWVKQSVQEDRKAELIKNVLSDLFPNF
jgi:hypothetical protein